MGAIRRAGVWLGLVEEEDDANAERRFDDEFGDEDDDYASAARPRSLTRQRTAERGRADDRDGRGERRRLGERDVRMNDHGRGDATRENLRSERADRSERSDRSDRSERADRAEHARLQTDHARGDHTRGDHARMDHGRTDHARTDHGRSEYARTDPGRTERASVRHLSRPGASGYSTQDNLALAPQPEAGTRERVTTTEDGTCRITTLHPTSYNEARTIGEHFRDGFPVIMNLTEMDEPDAKRLVDFAAGLAFGLRGSMERVTNRVFLLSPPNIQVSAEDKARIAEGGFFEQP